MHAFEQAGGTIIHDSGGIETATVAQIRRAYPPALGPIWLVLSIPPRIKTSAVTALRVLHSATLARLLASPLP